MLVEVDVSLARTCPSTQEIGTEKGVQMFVALLHITLWACLPPAAVAGAEVLPLPLSTGPQSVVVRAVQSIESDSASQLDCQPFA